LKPFPPARALTHTLHPLLKCPLKDKSHDEAVAELLIALRQKTKAVGGLQNAAEKAKLNQIY
jgi:hypothetical protein